MITAMDDELIQAYTGTHYTVHAMSLLSCELARCLTPCWPATNATGWSAARL